MCHEPPKKHKNSKIKMSLQICLDLQETWRSAMWRGEPADSHGNLQSATEENEWRATSSKRRRWRAKLGPRYTPAALTAHFTAWEGLNAREYGYFKMLLLSYKVWLWSCFEGEPGLCCSVSSGSRPDQWSGVPVPHPGWESLWVRTIYPDHWWSQSQRSNPYVFFPQL